MSEFKYEDGYYYHDNEQCEKECRETKLAVMAQVEFEIENNSLRKEQSTYIDKTQKALLRCSCGYEEDVTDKIKYEYLPLEDSRKRYPFYISINLE